MHCQAHRDNQVFHSSLVSKIYDRNPLTAAVNVWASILFPITERAKHHIIHNLRRIQCLKSFFFPNVFPFERWIEWVKDNQMCSRKPKIRTKCAKSDTANTKHVVFSKMQKEKESNLESQLVENQPQNNTKRKEVVGFFVVFYRNLFFTFYFLLFYELCGSIVLSKF